MCGVTQFFYNSAKLLQILIVGLEINFSEWVNSQIWILHIMRIDYSFKIQYKKTINICLIST